MDGPAEVFSLAEYVFDEMRERGWKTGDVALRMGRDYATDLFCVELLLAVDDDTLVVDDGTFEGMARAFGVSASLLRNLRNTWLRWPDRRALFEAPDDVFTGGTTPPVH